MKTDFIESILFTVADMQQLIEPRDDLSKLILKYEPTKELNFDELELVAAAGHPSYHDFIKRLEDIN